MGKVTQRGGRMFIDGMNLSINLAHFLTREQIIERDRRHDQVAINSGKKQPRTRFESCGIGDRFFSCDLDNYHPACEAQTEALAAIMDYIQGEAIEAGDGLLLGGPPGGGKTHLVAGILNWVAGQGKTVGYVTLAGYFGELRDAMKEGRTESGIVGKYAGCDMLALEDLTFYRNGQGEYQAEKLWELLDRRWSRGVPTISTTNLSQNEFSRTFDPRTSRRLAAKVIHVPRTVWAGKTL